MVAEDEIRVTPGLQELCGMVYSGEIVLPDQTKSLSPFILGLIQRIKSSDMRQDIIGRQANLFSWITSDDQRGTQRVEAQEFLNECLMNSRNKTVV